MRDKVAEEQEFGLRRLKLKDIAEEEDFGWRFKLKDKVVSDEEQKDKVVSDEEPGFCYLKLFEPEHHADAVKLGSCPTVASVRVFANSRASPYAGGRFQLSVSSGRQGTIAHVEEVFEGGIKSVAILAALSKDTRVGMSTSVPVVASHDEVPASRYGARMELVPTQHLDRDVRVAFAIDQSTEAFTFTPRYSMHIQRIGDMFESVQLLSASFTLQVTGDNTSQLRCAVTDGVRTPNSNLAWASAPMGIWAIGNAAGATTTVLQLKEDHPFGREIRAPSLGILDPSFHFAFTSDVPALAVCRGVLRVRFSGVGLGAAINIAKEAGRKQRVVYVRQVGRIVGVEADEDNESDSDDDETDEGGISELAGKSVPSRK